MKLHRTYHFDPTWLLLAPTATAALLLMFFPFLNTPFILQPGIAVQRPLSSSFCLPPQQNPLVVSITALPSPAIFFDNHKADLQTLEKWLSSQYSDTQSLIIKADKYSPTGLVTEVLNTALQRGYSVILATTPHKQHEFMAP